MKILGIETVTKIGSLAISENGKILGQTTIGMHLNHASNIIGSLNNLLHSTGIKIKDIDAIAVDIGPGSFTGIRIGIASAMGLAQPDKKKMAGVCSLSILSFQARQFSKQKTLIPVIDAKRGAIYSAVYEIDNAEIRLSKSPYAATLEVLSKSLPASGFIFGPDIRKFREFIIHGEGVVVDTHNTYPSAGMVALIGERKISQDSVEKKLEPMYIHDIVLKK